MIIQGLTRISYGFTTAVAYIFALTALCFVGLPDVIYITSTTAGVSLAVLTNLVRACLHVRCAQTGVFATSLRKPAKNAGWIFRDVNNTYWDVFI